MVCIVKSSSHRDVVDFILSECLQIILLPHIRSEIFKHLLPMEIAFQGKNLMENSRDYEDWKGLAEDRDYWRH
jgi:hypothetical protein